MKRYPIKCFSVIVIVCVWLVGLPYLAQSAQVCVKTEKKCVQTQKQCVRTKQDCARIGKRCVATTSQCLQRNSRTGQCLSSQQVCTQYQEYCAQYRESCAQYQDVCTKWQDVCTQYQQGSGKPSCRSCAAQRNSCFSQCDRLRDLIEQNRCVNKCNHTYACVIGHDCQ